MCNDIKKMLIMLVGVLGIAAIVVGTVFALQNILQNKSVATEVAQVPVEKTADKTVAIVTDVKPHYITGSIPKRSCHKVKRVVYVQQQEQTPGAGAVIGAATGGILGSQIGGGDGRIVSSAAGAAIGALTGNSIQNSMNQPQPRTVYSTVCSTRYVETSIQKGYEVSYTFNGNKGMTIMKDQPLVGSVLPLLAS